MNSVEPAWMIPAGLRAARVGYDPWSTIDRRMSNQTAALRPLARQPLLLREGGRVMGQSRGI